MSEKANYVSEGSPGYAPSVERVIEDKGIRIGEAADMYGDLETAEEYGYVSRGLKSRHIQFIALGGTIGTGLFLGIGKALVTAGPLSVLLGYSITGFFIYAMMQCLGEMATWLPLPGAIPQFCARYVDGSVGFAVGWNNWYSSAITLCAEISAAAVVIAYWKGAADINPAPWITLIIILIICLNIFAVSIYGEAEFCFAAIKIVTIVGLLIMALCVDLGASPRGNRLGFYYWQNPGAMKLFIVGEDRADLGRFLGFFYTLANATFAYGGVEMVAVAAGEAEDPRRNIPKAVRRIFWRIMFFYILGALFIGMLVPSNDPTLTKAIHDGLANATASPWVVAIKNAMIPGLDSVINAVILTSASSAANAWLYTGSRYLYALSQNGQAPRFLLRCSKAGVPYWAVAVTASISLLTYLSCGSGGASQAFTWFQNLITLAQLFTWLSIQAAYLKFYYALKAQGVDRNTMVFKSPLQPYLGWSAFIFFAVIILFNGFYAFSPAFDIDSFVTNYVGIPIYFILLIFWKIFKRTRWIPSSEVDLYTGKAALDAADGHWPERIPRNVFERIWFWIA